jgi:hypothetical protein
MRSDKVMTKKRDNKPVIVTPEELAATLPETPREGQLKLTAEEFSVARLEPWNRGGWLCWIKLRSGLKPNERLTTQEWLGIWEIYKSSPAG